MMQQISNKALSILIFVIGILVAMAPNAVQAQVEFETGDGSGTGFSRAEAVAAAVAEAAGRAFGIKINADTVAISIYKESSDNFQYLDLVNRTITSKIRTPNNRPIVSYDVLSTERDLDGVWNASVQITYAHYNKVGSNTNRRSVIVVGDGSHNTVLAREQILKSIISTRRFDVLDRDNRFFFSEEREFIRSEDVAAKELSRLGNATGADYLAIVKMEYLNIRTSSEKIRLTGEVLYDTSVQGRISLEMIEFSSRKTKWQKHQDFSLRLGGARGVSEGKVADLVAGAAKDLVTSMISAIYPIQVVKISGKTVIINRGEGAVKIGETYRVFAKGEDLIDPQSAENLGVLEEEIGTGVIVDVKPKFAYLEMQGVSLDPSRSYLLRTVGKHGAASLKKNNNARHKQESKSKIQKPDKYRDELLIK